MAAINHGGTFYRLIKVRSLVTAAKQTSWPCILQASKSCRSHSHLKAFRSAIASLKLKRKATASEQSHSRPSPFCHPPRNGLTASLLLIPLTPYKEVIFNREDSTRVYRGCTRGPQPRYGLAVLPMTLLSTTIAAYPIGAIWTIAFPINW